MTLNGTASHDDHRIVAYTWRCLSGPNNATIINYNESVANATQLTKGQYVFSVTVLDDNGNSASDNVTVTVTQSKSLQSTTSSLDFCIPLFPFLYFGIVIMKCDKSEINRFQITSYAYFFYIHFLYRYVSYLGTNWYFVIA